MSHLQPLAEWDPERVPRVDTIESLAEAVQAFDAAPLGLEVDPEADAAVRESCSGPAWC